ncbi:hypothetical protein DFH08DRAFT_1026037 [Mycena albidolilacea]|uniref:Uncharacterized protein n=1 Tax=Mycena albidolilacea TaxID=1033008 RepID=A0AAD6ZLF2_9AGAR|nr:hypothetical protein DFH08DRAFT_1026037 [Mycena albidolilacea]
MVSRLPASSNFRPSFFFSVFSVPSCLELVMDPYSYTSHPSILPSSSPAHPPSSPLSPLRSPLLLHPTQLLPVPLLPRHPLRSACLVTHGANLSNTSSFFVLGSLTWSFFPGTPPASFSHLHPPPPRCYGCFAGVASRWCHVITVAALPYRPSASLCDGRISLLHPLLPPICASHTILSPFLARILPSFLAGALDDINSGSGSRTHSGFPFATRFLCPPAPFFSAFVRVVTAGPVPRVRAYPCTPLKHHCSAFFSVRIDPCVVREPRNRRPHAPRHLCALCSAVLLRIPITASASPVPGGASVFSRRHGRRHPGRVKLPLLFSSRPRPARSTLPSASSSSPHFSVAPPPHPLRCPRPPRPPPPLSSSLHPVPPTADRHYLRSQDTETVLYIRQSAIDGEGGGMWAMCALAGWFFLFCLAFSLSPRSSCESAFECGGGVLGIYFERPLALVNDARQLDLHSGGWLTARAASLRPRSAADAECVDSLLDRAYVILDAYLAARWAHPPPSPTARMMRSQLRHILPLF